MPGIVCNASSASTAIDPLCTTSRGSVISIWLMRCPDADVERQLDDAWFAPGLVLFGDRWWWDHGMAGSQIGCGVAPTGRPPPSNYGAHR